MAPGQPPGLRDRVRRAFVHEEMKKVCEQFRQGNMNNLNPAIRALIVPPIDPALANVADAFVELQEARHAADYDVADTFTRADVLAKIALVDQSFADWKTLQKTPNGNVFIAALLLNRLWRSST
jgi:hypothetical protein